MVKALHPIIPHILILHLIRVRILSFIHFDLDIDLLLILILGIIFIHIFILENKFIHYLIYFSHFINLPNN